MVRGSFAHRAVAAFFFVAVPAWAGGAHADAPKSAPPRPEVSEGPTSDELAEQGFKAYEAGDFPAAVGFYMRAFQISNDSRILYNVASIYDRKLHDRSLAEDFYRRYLKSPTTEQELVKKSNERLVEMKKEVPPPAPPAPPAPPPRRPPPPLPITTVGLVVAGVGVAGLAVGTIFGVSALSKADDLETQCPNDVCTNGDGPTLRDDAATAATLSTVFIIAGLAFIAGGGAAYLLAPKGAKTTGVGVRPLANIARPGGTLAVTF